MTDRPPVILLPGAFGQELVYWNVWEYFMEKDGFRVYPVSFPRFTLTDLTTSAKLLAQKVEEVKAIEDADRVALVGHSMGGLIARHYLKFLGGEDHVSRLACLGVPHYGTWFGATGPVLRGARQVLPGSEFLNELNDPKRPHATPILNIWSPYDGVVIPAKSSLLDLPNVDNRTLPFAGHWGMLVSRRAYRWVKEAFEGDGTIPRAPKSAGGDVLREARN